MDEGYSNKKWERGGDDIFSRPSYIKDMSFSRPSHNKAILILLHTLTYKEWQFHDPLIQKVPFSRPPIQKLTFIPSLHIFNGIAQNVVIFAVIGENRHSKVGE